MEIVPQGAPNGVHIPPPPLGADPSVVVQHLVNVLEITLGAIRRDLENVGSLLSKSKYSDTLQRCNRFASESQVAIYAQKDIAAADQVNGTQDGHRKCRDDYILNRLTDSEMMAPGIHTLCHLRSPSRRRP